MAAYTYSVPVLAGNSLPDPSEIDVRVKFLGGSEEMADGKVVHDLIAPDAKRNFTYKWNYVDDFSGILAGWTALKSEAGSLVHIDGQTYSVMRPTNSKDLSYRAIKTAAGIVWVDISLNLVEV